MRCIFCLQDKASSAEHVFPDAIGGSLRIDRVCKTCNDFLGAKVDPLLTDYQLILLKRAQLGIGNRDGKVPDVWNRVFGVGAMASDPDQKIRLVRDPTTGELVPHLIHQSCKLKLDDGREVLQIKIDAKDADQIGKIIQRVRKRAGLPPLSEADLKREVELAQANTGHVDRPEIKYSVQIKSPNYRRALFKIAYELAWLWLGDEYLADPIAEQFRRAILLDAEEEFRGTILPGDDMQLFLFWRNEPTLHIGMCAPARGYLSASFRIFDVVSGTMMISESPERYPALNLASDAGLFVAIDPRTGALRRSSIGAEIQKLIGSRRALNSE